MVTLLRFPCKGPGVGLDGAARRTSSHGAGLALGCVLAYPDGVVRRFSIVAVDRALSCSLWFR